MPHPYTCESASSPSYLHFTSRSKDIACLCNRPRRHERWYPVAESDPSAEDSILLYLRETGTETCTKAEWTAILKRYQANITPMLSQTLHYMNEKKDVVCRCRSPRQHRGIATRVRNEEIHNLASRYFVTNPSMMRCTRANWRTTRGSSDYERTLNISSAPAQASTNISSPLNLPGSDKWSEWKATTNAQVTPAMSSVPPSLSTASNITPSPIDYKPKYSFQSTVPSERIRERHSRSDTKKRATTSTANSFDPASVISLDKSISSFENRYGRLSFNPWDGSGEASTHPIQMAKSVPVPHLEETVSEHSGTSVPRALSTLPREQNFGAKPPIRNKLTDFHENQPCRAGERTFTEATEHKQGHLTSVSCIPVSKKKLPKEMLNHRERQASSQNVPTQSELLSRSTISTLRKAQGLSFEKCEICRMPFGSQMSTPDIYVLSCRHHVHRACLIEHIRHYDQGSAACPTCDTLLCERTLSDRIKMDKEALFGQLVTKLPQPVEIELPDRNTIAECLTEEILAATLLRVLKSFVQTHLGEERTRCSDGAGELDWYKVVKNSLISFRQAGLHLKQCKYISNQNSWLKFVLWAELARLMNGSCTLTQRLDDSVHRLPSLDVLHTEFFQAWSRFNEEKLLWVGNRDKIAPWEYLANEVYKVAIKTQ